MHTRYILGVRPINVSPHISIIFYYSSVVGDDDGIEKKLYRFMISLILSVSSIKADLPDNDGKLKRASAFFGRALLLYHILKLYTQKFYPNIPRPKKVSSCPRSTRTIMTGATNFIQKS